MDSPSENLLLRHLARLYGVQTAYYDVLRHRQQAPVESLLAILRSLGAPLANLQDIPQAWREQRQVHWQRLLEPVIVTWDSATPSLKINLPFNHDEVILNCQLTLESGERLSWEWSGADLSEITVADIEGMQYVVKKLTLPIRLPLGYHQFLLKIKAQQHEALIISAPSKAYHPPAEAKNRIWGVFLPLYALHKDQNWGSGDFSTLEALTTWVADMGGRLVATLPLLAAYWGSPIEHSPYLPSSRLLWNEFYLDIEKIPEFPRCPSAQALLASSSGQNEITALRNSRLVDYHRLVTLKRKILEELCRRLFSEPSDRLKDLHQFAETNPVIENYARFRAASEKYGSSWKYWPQSVQKGILNETDYDEETKCYHLYTQWLTHQQMKSVSVRAKEKNIKLYLDLPVGVHPDGYDVWREREAFISGASAGAPPDTVFTKGQNWGFPPLHPEKIRDQHYRYLIACLRHHLQYAEVLRIDHIMGLHRLFCIPHGLDTSHGVYLRYHAEEFYAILALESQRHQAIIVGEDLGIVPPYVRTAMKNHGLHRMYVLHYELTSNPQKGALPVPQDSIASLNTHDMPPFASFWQGQDIEEQRKLGLLDREGGRKERAVRRKMIKVLRTFLQRKNWLQKPNTGTATALKACLSFLADSKAHIALVNLEDLWGETQPQNVPSTREEYPNWQRKALYSLEEFCQMPQVLDTLDIINRLRKQDGQC